MPHKRNSKIIRVGNTSFAVILPRSWLRYYELGYGDTVEVISNGNIMIKPSQKGGKSS